MLRSEFQKIIVKNFASSSKRNIHSLPKLKRVVINYRITDVRESQEATAAAQTEIMAITGQKPRLCKAKKSVAAFKLRQNEPLAFKVTLRGARMYDFVEKLFNLVLPRLRDFRGLSNTAFDTAGNYNLTIHDQTYFPEIDLDKVTKIRAVQITFNLSASSQEEAKMLLSALGLAFKKE